MRQYSEHIKTKDLRPNPRNKHIFGDVTEGLQPLVNSIKRAGILSPIVVTSKKFIANGHRRHAAAMAIGLDTVPCFVSECDTPEGAMKAWRECQTTERQTTNEQRLRLAEEELILLAEDRPKPPQVEPVFSGSAEPENQNELTGEVAEEDTEEKTPRKRGRPAVEKTKKQIEKEAAAAAGTSRSTAMRGKKVLQAITEAEEAGDTVKAEQLREALNKSVTAAAELVSKPEAVTEPVPPTDAAGKPIPENLISTFEKRQLFQDVISACRKVTAAIKILSEDPHETATIKFNSSQAKNDLKNLLQQVNYAIPHAVCPYCRGRGQAKGAGCQPCKGIGWLVKSAYDFIPEDVR